MSGKTDIPLIVISLISIVAAVTDVARGRIYNWLTLPSLLAGLLFTLTFGALASGWSGALAAGGDSLLGTVAGLVLYGWMFWIGVLGGGDVKFLMALGAWGGFHYSVEVALLGVFLGGVMACLILIFTGRIRDFGRRMYRFLLTIAVKELEVETPRIDHKLTMPFGVPIAVAAVWVAVSNPFERWGMRLWS